MWKTMVYVLIEPNKIEVPSIREAEKLIARLYYCNIKAKIVVE